jgi:formate C-acetyltransferase
MESVKSLELALFRGQENPSTPFRPFTKWAHFQKPGVYRTRLTLGHDSGDFSRMTSFDEVYTAFLDQYGYQIDRYMDVLAQEVLKNASEDVFHTSPIVAGLNEKALDTGVDPMRGGWPVPNYQLLSGSIPTLADALYAIQEGVFARGLCTMEELIHALSVDFEGYEDLRLALKKLPKFGNDADAVDQLAADLAAFSCQRVEDYPTPLGIKPLPGIYNIDFNTFAGSIGATPDGRKGGELICEHYSPTPGNAKNGPTAVIQSAAKADLRRGCASSPLYLVLPRGLGAVDIRLITRMMKSCGEAGLPVVSISIYDKSVLEDALLHPEKHEDLVVRVWGFNARFIDLDEGLKRHVMSRIL